MDGDEQKKPPLTPAEKLRLIYGPKLAKLDHEYKVKKAKESPDGPGFWQELVDFFKGNEGPRER